MAANWSNFERSRWVSGPGLPSPIGVPSMRTTGITVLVADVMKASRACKRLGDTKRSLEKWHLLLLQEVDQRGSRHPGENSRRDLPGDDSSFVGDDPGVTRRALGDEAVAVDKPRLARAVARAPPPWRGRPAAASPS